jgi:acetyl-CoA acetyltransferase
MPTSLRDEAAIAGIGQTKFTKNSGVSELALACEAVSKAIDDAGMEPSEIDGLTTFSLDTNDEIDVARAVGIGDLHLFSRVPYGGGAATAIVHQAVMAVATGTCKAVVCYRALNGRSGQRYSQGVSGDIVTSDLVHWSWYMPWGLLTPTSWVAMFTQRYMHDYGVAPEQLAEVALATRAHAVNNPEAFFYERPLTLDDYMGARFIAEPLRLFDCCQETDGGCAVVVTTPERARDCPQPPVLIRGVASAAGADQEQMTSFYRPSISHLPEMELVAEQMWKVAGLGPRDVDAAVIYDAFTSIVLLQLEAFGFCGRGEGGDFVADGALGLSGRLPTNTHGGQLSEAYIHGVNGINEGVRLVRGTSTNQPAKHDHVLVTSGVGVPTSAMVLARAS